jgi:cell division protein FtsI (penicillin-binding protein 3)/stage V sporulation protein D (sporulation-specific penicillin-binding protein)
MKWNSRTRCAIICIAFAALFSAFSFRLVYLQVIKHEEYSALAADKHGFKQTIHAERGAIYDTNGEVLAHNVPGETVIVDGSLVNNADALIPFLADILKLPASELTPKVVTDRRYVVLKRQVPQEITNELRQKLAKRTSKASTTSATLRAFIQMARCFATSSASPTSIQRGIQGVELSMEQYLHGQDGFRFIERNRAGQELVPYRGQERAPRDGYRVNLTIDLNLQNIVENEIDAAVKEYSPEKATIILMRPGHRRSARDGESPAFQPQRTRRRQAGADEEPRHHRHDGARLDLQDRHRGRRVERKEGKPDSYIFCENGVWNYGGRPLHDHHGYGSMSVQDILIKSSNIGAAKLAISIGEQKFYEYIRRFGFGERTGIESAGRDPGVIRSPQSWSKISITRIPMGHEVGVTPLQMTTAMAAIANGGKLITPRIVKSITTSDGKTIAEFTPNVCVRSSRRRSPRR